ncbi:MAG: hypothetical protein PHU75_03785 [Candidatus Nanopelagicales bacterium]|nr:hypothetical protein [Candidatus Nanopelagicales bacterium]
MIPLLRVLDEHQVHDVLRWYLARVEYGVGRSGVIQDAVWGGSHCESAELCRFGAIGQALEACPHKIPIGYTGTTERLCPTYQLVVVRWHADDLSRRVGVEDTEQVKRLESLARRLADDPRTALCCGWLGLRFGRCASEDAEFVRGE